MKKDIIFKGNAILTKVARNISPNDILHKKVQQVITDLHDTLAKTNKGVGLAAPQIGESIRVFVISPTVFQNETESVSEILFPTFVNPTIIRRSKDAKKMQEGCLSIPGIVGDVRRSSRVVVEAYDMKGELFRFSAKGFLAQIIQHENDHLDGILFDTKATDLREI